MTAICEARMLHKHQILRCSLPDGHMGEHIHCSAGGVLKTEQLPLTVKIPRCKCGWMPTTRIVTGVDAVTQVQSPVTLWVCHNPDCDFQGDLDPIWVEVSEAAAPNAQNT